MPFLDGDALRAGRGAGLEQNAPRRPVVMDRPLAVHDQQPRAAERVEKPPIGAPVPVRGMADRDGETVLVEEPLQIGHHPRASMMPVHTRIVQHRDRNSHRHA